MKILALEIEVPEASPDDMKALLKLEAARVWEHYQQGVIREAYFQADRRLAVLVLECGDLSTARAVIGSLPLVEAGLIDFNLIPLVPYDGFARLFAAPGD